MNNLFIKSFSTSSVCVYGSLDSLVSTAKENVGKGEGDHRAEIMITHSQLAPLPSELPFHIVSKTIGQGAYAW